MYWFGAVSNVLVVVLSCGDFTANSYLLKIRFVGIDCYVLDNINLNYLLNVLDNEMFIKS